MAHNLWKTISSDEYKVLFERFGGSFVVHPDVVAVIASLSKRSVRYVGLIRDGHLLPQFRLGTLHRCHYACYFEM